MFVNKPMYIYVITLHLNFLIFQFNTLLLVGGDYPIMPDILQEAKVGIYSTAKCQQMYTGVGGADILPGHICVGEEGLRGACSVSIPGQNRERGMGPVA